MAPSEFGARPRGALLVRFAPRRAVGGARRVRPRSGTAAFTEEDEQLLRTFAASAANAVAINRSVEADRLRAAIAAADEERKRWARELHDQTLQSLGGLRVSLASILGRGDAAAKDARIRQAITDIELEIGNLRGIISDLRPSMLDDLGLRAGDRSDARSPPRPGSHHQRAIAVGPWSETVELAPDLETAIYRIVQEALANVASHSQADSARVSVVRCGDEVLIDIEDDGVGFDIEAATGGFGLAGMRERAYLAGGRLEIEPRHPGTGVHVRLPAGAAPLSPCRYPPLSRWRRSANWTSSARVLPRAC